MEAWSVLIPSFKIAYSDEFLWRFVIVDNLHTTVRDATIFTGLGSSRRTSVSQSGNAELLSSTTITPDVATRLDWARIEVRNLAHVTRLLGPGNLRSTDGIL